MENNGIYKNLVAQIEKIFKHVNQGSIQTRRRYREAVYRFCKFLADEFRLQKFTNVQEKHIRAYVEKMKVDEASASTIKTDLAAIRFVYDQAGGRHKLPANAELGLERRIFGGTWRAWTPEEYEGALRMAREHGDHRVEWALRMARHMGLRIHEITRLDHAQVSRALRDGELVIKGKGGKIRTVPVTPGGRAVMEDMVRGTARGRKVFVRPEEKTHVAIRHIQGWISEHRAEFSARRITIHGLRHTYAQDRYAEAVEKYGDDRKAREAVSRLIGHERDDVTRIYLADENSPRSV